MIAHRKHQKSTRARQPVVSVVPNSHPHFRFVRTLLYRPNFLQCLREVLKLLCQPGAQKAAKSVDEGARRQVLLRIVHLVTLQLLCLDEVRQIVEVPESCSGANNYFAEITGVSDTAHSSILHLLAQLHKENELADELYSPGLGWCLKEFAHRDRCVTCFTQSSKC